MLEAAEAGVRISATQASMGASIMWARLQVRTASALAFWGWQGGAIQAYRDALRVDPDLIEAHYRLGETLARCERWAEAAVAFRAVLRLKPASEDALGNLILAAGRAGQYQEGVAGLRRLIYLHPNSAELQMLIGVLLRQLNRRPEAIRCFRRAVELRPSAATKRFYLGEALLGHDQWRRLVQAHAEAQAIDPPEGVFASLGSQLNRPPVRPARAGGGHFPRFLLAVRDDYLATLRRAGDRLALSYHMSCGRGRVWLGRLSRRHCRPHLAIRSFRRAYRLISDSPVYLLRGDSAEISGELLAHSGRAPADE